MGSIRGVLLDIDGTLVDSNDAHARAWVKAFAEGGFDVAFEDVRPLIGMGGDKILDKLAGLDEDDAQGNIISIRRCEIFKQAFLPSLRPFLRVRELLSLMRSRGLRLVAASSTRADELRGLLKVCGAEDLLHEQTSSDDAEESKSDPDIVAAALDKIGLPAAEVVMLGDTPYDVEAAARAKVATIALLCGGWDRDHLKGATAVYADPADLLENLDTSLLGRSAAL
jgi:phosphoglycolate phosphatase-like HAD superfamily hydrolase